MTRPATPSVVTALGFSPAVDQVYHRVLAQSGRELVSVAAALLSTTDELLAQLAGLVEVGIVKLEGSRVFVENPAETVARMVAEQATSAAVAHARLELVSAAIPLLAGAAARPAPGAVLDVHPLDGELSSGGHVIDLLEALISQSTGDLLWLRPDQWRLPREDLMAEVVAAAVASGRRSRAIYPARAVRVAWPTLASRVELGEEIRVLPDLPTRMLIIGASHAILPEPLGFADEPRMLIRQRGLVEALTRWFEQLWERAVALPPADGDDTRPDVRRLLLQQLAAGAQDEQIARRLGISLRTVRRRVADLLAELSAETRFQAGVEAGRRGWL